MKKRFLSILFAMLLVVLPFTLIGCNNPDDSTSNSGAEGQLLTLQDYHNEIKSIADFCGLVINEPNTSMTLNDNARDSFSPNLKFIGPIGNYGDLEIVFYNNLAKVTLENKLFTTQEGNKPVDLPLKKETNLSIIVIVNLETLLIPCTLIQPKKSG